MLADNLKHRELFTLPPIKTSTETALAVQALPKQKKVTGDKELDAVLWLREVISTGQPGPIATALEAFKKIKTPAKELDKRYSEYLIKASGGNTLAAVFGSFGFTDLSELANRSLREAELRVEAQARFDGETIWDDTPAELLCKQALKACGKSFKSYIDYDKQAAGDCFRSWSGLMPHTLSDCLHEIAYWKHLYSLRKAVGYDGDGLDEAIAREWFVEGLLAEIEPRDHEEALAVLEYADAAEGIEHDGLIAVVRNLLRLSPSLAAGTVDSGDATNNLLGIKLDAPAPWASLPLGARVTVAVSRKDGR